MAGAEHHPDETGAARDLVWALSPGSRPDPEIVLAAGRAGALGVLDLGLDRGGALEALAVVAGRARGAFAVRVGTESPVGPERLPDIVDTVVVPSATAVAAWSRSGRRVAVEVATAADAIAASTAGASLLVAPAGAVASVRDAVGPDLPVLAVADVEGGSIDDESAPALLAAGASGVVLSTELALLRESTLPIAERSARARHDAGAVRLARRFSTVGRLVNAVRRAIDAHPLTAPADEPRPVDIAIVGMACILPGATDVDTFWSNVVDGVASVTEVPPERWDTERYYDRDFDAGTLDTESPRSVSKWGGFVPDVEFDALAWGIPPMALAAIDPAQLMALKAAADALEDAGYGNPARGTAGRSGPSGVDHQRTSVIYATGSGGAADVSAGFLLRMLLPNFLGVLPPELDEWLPRISEDATPGILTSVIAGRVANRLDLGGKNLTVDAACASVLAGLDIACKELLAGGSDVVLCGGVDLHNAQQDYMIFTAAQALSKSGQCRSFDVDADGMTLGEGAGCLVLKRLADAERDGDRIYAVIKGISGSSDGRHLGLTAPRQEGQELSLRRAYRQCGVSPTEVGLVEAHGTGTVAGDKTELGTLTEVYGEAGVAPGAVVLGSVKSNIGHIKCAAGVTGLIKAAKSVYHGVLPPTLHLTHPNDAWDAATSPFRFLDRAQPWRVEQRIAAVSAFGFGGTNFHAILANYEDAPLPVVARDRWPAELFAIRAANEAEVDAVLDSLIARVADELSWPVVLERFRLRDLAAAISAAGPADAPVRLAFVATDLADLHARAVAARTRQDVTGRPLHRSGSSAAFTGGSCSPAALIDLLVAFPGARAALDDDLAAMLLTPQAFTDEARAAHAAALADPAVVASLDELAAAIVATVAADLGLADDARTDLIAATTGADHGLVALLDGLARLAVTGIAIDLAALHTARNSDASRWLDAPERARWIVNGFMVRTADGASLRHGLRPMSTAPLVERGELVPVNGGPGSTAHGLNDAVLLAYLQSTNELITTGVDIIRHVGGIDPAMAALLTGAAPPNGLAPAAPIAPVAPAAAAPAAATSAVPSPPSAPSAPSAPSVDDGVAAARALLAQPAVLLERLVGIVSARTGYPPDMLDPDLDVEADLSIDSIKRIEILGELADQIGLGGDDGQLEQLESLVEELATRKTLRSIVDWLVEQGDLLTGAAAPVGAAR